MVALRTAAGPVAIRGATEGRRRQHQDAVADEVPHPRRADSRARARAGRRRRRRSATRTRSGRARRHRAVEPRRQPGAVRLPRLVGPAGLEGGQPGVEVARASRRLGRPAPARAAATTARTSGSAESSQVGDDDQVGGCRERPAGAGRRRRLRAGRPAGQPADGVEGRREGEQAAAARRRASCGGRRGPGRRGTRIEPPVSVPSPIGGVAERDGAALPLDGAAGERSGARGFGGVP